MYLLSSLSKKLKKKGTGKWEKCMKCVSQKKVGTVITSGDVLSVFAA